MAQMPNLLSPSEDLFPPGTSVRDQQRANEARDTQAREFSYKAHLTREQHALRMVRAQPTLQKNMGSVDDFYTDAYMDPTTINPFTQQDAENSDAPDRDLPAKKPKEWVDAFPFNLLKYPFFIPLLMYKFLSGGISEATDELTSRAAPIKKIYGA